MRTGYYILILVFIITCGDDTTYHDTVSAGDDLYGGTEPEGGAFTEYSSGFFVSGINIDGNIDFGHLGDQLYLFFRGNFRYNSEDICAEPIIIVSDSTRQEELKAPSQHPGYIGELADTYGEQWYKVGDEWLDAKYVHIYCEAVNKDLAVAKLIKV